MKLAKAIEKTIKVCSVCGYEINETTQCDECLDFITDDEFYCDDDDFQLLKHVHKKCVDKNEVEE